MARHYIKVPEFIRDYYPGGAPANWREAIVADATEDGTCLTYEPLVANDRGPRIAVHGDKYYFWFGRDQYRSDTLFVMRIEPARSPRQTPTQYAGMFARWPGGEPPPLDPVDSLFGVTEDAGADGEGDVFPNAAEPTPLLLKKLSGLMSGQVAPFRPRADAVLPEDVAKAVEEFRWFWRRYRLSGRVDVTPRLASVLQGGVTPSTLDAGEWRQLSEPFGIAALNVMALDDTSPERLGVAVADLADLPLEAHAKALLWTGLLRALGAQEIKREMHGASGELLRSVETGAEAEQAIEEGILLALREVAIRDADTTLQEVYSAATLAEDPLQHLARWAAALEFADTVAPRPVVAPVEAEPVAQAPPVDAGTGEAARWLLRVAFPDHEALRALVGQVSDVSSRIREHATGASLSDLLTSLDEVHGLRDRLQTGVSRLPTPTEVADLARQARQALAEVESCLGAADLERLLSECSLGPADLTAIVRLLQEQVDLILAPAWLVWPDEDAPFPVAEVTPFALAVLLADPERRARWQRFLDYLRQLGERETVRWLRPPADGATVEDALLDWFEGTRTFLDSLTPQARAEALADPGSSPTALVELERELSELAGRLSTEAEAALRTLVADRAREAMLPAVRALALRVDEFCRTTKLKAGMVTGDMLAEWAGQHVEPVHEPALRVVHNWVGQFGARATLSLVRDDEGRALGYFEAPLVIESDEPREWTLRMRWDVRGDWRANWPAEFPSIEPEQLSIARYQWRRDGEDGPYQHTFTLRVPVRVYRDLRRRTLEVSLSVQDGVSGDALVRDHNLRWDALSYDQVPVTVAWSTAGRPDDVDEHPIGPQARARTILDRLSALSCTAVIAPRRFGKTTLVNYLVRELKERNLHAPPPIVCTDFRLGQELDYAALWSRVSDDLYEQYDTGLPGGWSEPLPPAEAFDAVRRAAHKNGHKAIVLIFDEAQLFFPSDRGPEIGSRLKGRLESSWCQPTEGLAPVLFCLVGLPPLVQRAGADLAGLLVPIEASGMTEDELRPLIGGKVPALQTTRALRTELARTAGNLFILRVLLQRLADQVSRAGRIWASIDDLTEVSRALAYELREGREESVAAYIRDVLNEADDVNVWQPMVCVPVAAAIADQRPAAATPEALLQRATARLNEWSKASFTDTRGVPSYDEQGVRRHVARLTEIKVLRHTGEFQSSFLEAWLAGLARRWTSDEQFRAALFSGGQRRIPVPSGAALVHEARSTRILKLDDPLGPLAYRLRTLQDDHDRQVFLDSVALFDAIRRAANRGEDGSAFIFRLEDVGLSGASEREAVQVYRWVEGETLAERLGALPPRLVIDIGIKLSRALVLLHGHGILHRDIQPGNVVIDEGEHASADLRPVLIDFGFARQADRQMRTRIAGEFAAPEVAADQPEWSRKSDVFGLSATLRAVLCQDMPGAGAVLDVLKEGLVSAPASRPSAEEISDRLEQLAVAQAVQQQRDEAWATIWKRLGPGQYVPELAATVKRHRTVLELLEARTYRVQEERHRVLADVANQCLERKRGAGLRGIATSTSSPEVAVLHALRVVHAHPETALQQNHKSALQAYRSANEDERARIVREALGVVSQQAGVPALANVLEVYA